MGILPTGGTVIPVPAVAAILFELSLQHVAMPVDHAAILLRIVRLSSLSPCHISLLIAHRADHDPSFLAGRGSLLTSQPTSKMGTQSSPQARQFRL